VTATLSRSTFTGLRCKECGHAYEPGARHVCEDVCFGPLEVVYDYEAIKRRVSRATIEAGPASIWRYRDFLRCSRPTTWPSALASRASTSRTMG
jgi:threonine synthase